MSIVAVGPGAGSNEQVSEVTAQNVAHRPLNSKVARVRPLSNI